MRLWRKYIGLILVPMLILAGCSEETTSKEAQPQKETKSQEETEQKPDYKVDLPKELKGHHVLAGPGKYAGDNYDEEKVKAEIDQFPKDLTPEQYYQKLLELLAEDYTSYIRFFETFDTSLNVVGQAPDGEVAIKLPKEKEVNVMILLDSSGSMAGTVEGGVKMDQAKKAVQDFAAKMPEGANVSLQVYGHEGSNQQKDKEMSCKSIENVYPLGEYNKTKFDSALKKFQPAGWTPLSRAMNAARKELSNHVGSNVQNIVYVVSDGVETCDGDPVAAAEKLNQSEMKAVVNIIGFDVDDDGQKALKSVAEAGGGTYQTADSGADLEEQLDQEYDRLWRQWDQWEDTQQRKVDKLDDKKVKVIDETDDKMVRLADEEDDRLQDALDYLDDHDEINVEGVSQWINERESVLQDYSNAKESELTDAVNENESRLQDDLNKREDEAREKYQ
ncbi:D-amino-acid dehydrogenase [Melghirimyces thermohalophilus]|uniref:D-amino-acid dehydrogenase n=1 Tax=Melghirimyces thermohalophilus TaxID=1236220 RepID=A0A1G6Q392_9BACL|nr:VWA domain-containing protein [Melghirimyces thermohalophilus]SDC86910.1 D-amino-acid dehydrogenase [Melghirimyces thermohalophilus]